MDLGMNNDEIENNQELVFKLGETLSRIQAPLQKIAETVKAANQTFIAVTQSDAVQNALRMGQELVKTITAFDFKPILKKFSEAMIPLKYIHLLERLQWPLFLINDDDLREQIMSACAESDDADAVKELVFEYCDEDFLVALEEDWSDCPVIKQGRMPILAEAIQMHKQGFYYTSVSTLMCQVYGIAADIDNLAKENGLTLDEEEKAFIADYFEVNIKFINNEKGRLLQSLMLTESSVLLWDAMGNYIKNITLYSGKDYSHIENQPLRNKIAHGDQVDFGTQEHSLKAILTVDMLIQLAYEINRVVQLRKCESNTDENGGSEK